MLKRKIFLNTIIAAIVVTLLSVNYASAQVKKDSSKAVKNKKEMSKTMDCCSDVDKSKSNEKAIDQPGNNDKKGLQSKVNSESKSIVRSVIIDLAQIDINKDGKVFQCPMELNIISDEKGNCPECGMKLREISVDDAKTKLIKKGYKVK